MVASTLGVLRRWWPAAAGAAAALFIAVMIGTGSEPESQQLIKFEAKGVMQRAPEQVTAVAIQFAGNTYKLERTGLRAWTRAGGGPLGAQQAADATMAVQFMNTAAPARTLTAEELPSPDLAAFGLAAPRVSVTLFAGSAPILAAHFGAKNPDGMLQYMRVDGRRELFLMSRFVGQQWEALAATFPGAKE